MRCATALSLVLACGLAAAAHAGGGGERGGGAGGGADGPRRGLGERRDSGWVENGEAGTGARVVYSTTLMAARAAWVRVRFGGVILSGDAETERASYVLVTSLADGASQRLDARRMREWGGVSAYFNGDAVRIDVVSWEGAGPSRVVVEGLVAGEAWAGGGDSLCGPESRVLSQDSRVARVLPAGGGVCTGFIIGDSARCMLSAGQCAPGAGTVVEFNVPLSSGAGVMMHPAPEQQYAVDATSVQLQSAGAGSDWAYFGVFANSNTGLGAASAQGGAYAIGAAPAAGGQNVWLTGYGTVLAPAPAAWSQAQKLDTGLYVGLVGTEVRHQVDATAGDAGAPIRLGNGVAIGIHGGDGCVNPPGASFNTGTAVQNVALQAALAAPAGLCAAAMGPPEPPVYLAGAPGNLLTVSRTSGGFGTVGATGIAGEIAGLAYDRGRGRFYASEAVPGGPDNLYFLNRATGAATLIGAVAGPADVSGLAFDPNTDTLYGIDQGTGQLYRIGIVNAAATPVGAASGPGVGGIDADPARGIIYGVDDSGTGTRLVRIDAATGARTVVGALGAGITDCDGLAYCPDDRFLYTVDQGTGRTLRVDPATGAAAVVGAAGPLGGAGLGMACDYECAAPCVPGGASPAPGAQQQPITSNLAWLGCPNQKVFSLDVQPSLGVRTLNDVVTATGGSTLVGPLTGTSQLTGMAWNGQAMMAVDLATGNLVRIDTTTGAATVVGATGLSGWQGLAADNTDNGQLYGITQNNTLYRVSAASGAATQVGTGVGNLVTALEFDRLGQLWGIEFTTGRVLRIDKRNGSVSVSGTTIAGFQGMDFDDAGVCYAHNSSGADRLYTVNLATGMATLRGPSNTSTVTAMAFGMAADFGGSPPPPPARGGAAVFDPTNLTETAPAVIDWSKVIDREHGGVPEGMVAVEGVLYEKKGAPVLPPPPGAGGADAPCGGTLLNFDAGAAPCSFGLATRLTRQFSSVGVVFEGPGGNDGGAVLSECAGLGVSGMSSPNSLAFNPAAVLADGGVPRGVETLRFTSPVSSVQALVASASGGMVTMEAYRGGTLVATKSQPLTAAAAPISVAGSGITRVTVSFTGTLVLDDVCFVQSCPTTYDVYFGPTDPPTVRVLADSVNTVFDPGALESTTLYYWRVVAKNCCGQTAGPVWSFSTLCYPNCDESTSPPVLNVNDFLCFVNRYAAGDPYANCDDSTAAPVLNVNDFLCFTNRFAAGCP